MLETPPRVPRGRYTCGRRTPRPVSRALGHPDPPRRASGTRTLPGGRRAPGPSPAGIGHWGLRPLGRGQARGFGPFPEGLRRSGAAPPPSPRGPVEGAGAESRPGPQARGGAAPARPPQAGGTGPGILGCAGAGLGRGGGARPVSVSPGCGWGTGLASPCPALETAAPHSAPARRRPARGAARAHPARSGSAYLRARGPAAEAGGKLPRPACWHRRGRLCVCARERPGVRRGVRRSVRPRAGGRGPPSVSRGLRPEMPPPLAAAGGSQVAAWPRSSQSPSPGPRAPRPRARSSPRRRRPQEPVLNGQLHAPRPRARRPGPGAAAAAAPASRRSTRASLRPLCAPAARQGRHLPCLGDSCSLPGRRQGTAYGDLSPLGAEIYKKKMKNTQWENEQHIQTAKHISFLNPWLLWNRPTPTFLLTFHLELKDWKFLLGRKLGT
ncbi:uncharacterized protein [Vulpes vulpes]|uniref:Collagen alpha-1(I) chain-like n=1 Tax=Vulpes vulpes TaxID=9627 RepID=A0ABM4YHP0_VULVU